jgi:hypothetical protein
MSIDHYYGYEKKVGVMIGIYLWVISEVYDLNI